MKCACVCSQLTAFVYQMIFKFLSELQQKSVLIINRNAHKVSKMKYLNQEEAINVDLELFNDYKFSGKSKFHLKLNKLIFFNLVDQLMELAGLSCAHAIAKEFKIKENNKALIVCGPGNNGGDGLVLARHLSLMKYVPSIYYPKRTEKLLYNNLINQCTMMGIEFLTACPENADSFLFITDALFGFSFKPPVRDSFADIMELMYATKTPICSIDIPSGWDVEKGQVADKSINPYMLVSLTAPKLCARDFKGIHYLGGRFVPQALADKYQLNLPEYEGTESCIKLN